jgi:hypothetical protein
VRERKLVKRYTWNPVFESEMRARDIWGEEKEETERPTTLNLDLMEEK